MSTFTATKTKNRMKRELLAKISEKTVDTMSEEEDFFSYNSLNLTNFTDLGKALDAMSDKKERIVHPDREKVLVKECVLSKKKVESTQLTLVDSVMALLLADNVSLTGITSDFALVVAHDIRIKHALGIHHVYVGRDIQVEENLCENLSLIHVQKEDNCSDVSNAAKMAYSAKSQKTAIKAYELYCGVLKAMSSFIGNPLCRDLFRRPLIKPVLDTQTKFTFPLADDNVPVTQADIEQAHGLVKQLTTRSLEECKQILFDMSLVDIIPGYNKQLDKAVMNYILQMLIENILLPNRVDLQWFNDTLKNKLGQNADLVEVDNLLETIRSQQDDADKLKETKVASADTHQENDNDIIELDEISQQNEIPANDM